MPSTLRVLSTDLACADYEALGAHLRARCQQPGPYAVDFSNTHIVTMRRHDPAFAATTACIDWPSSTLINFHSIPSQND